MKTVELQINIHPNDCRHFYLMAIHQINAFKSQITSIRLTLDLHNSANGRYRSEQYDSNLVSIKNAIELLKKIFPEVICDEVDYSRATIKKVANSFFKLDHVPSKAWDGGPFYSYLYGIWSSNADYIIHIDSDIFFGGLSKSWVLEAIEILNSDLSLVFICPLSGPPHPQGFLFGHRLQMGKELIRHTLPGAYFFHSVSTRIFLTSKKIIHERVGQFKLLRPNFLMRIKAIILGNSSASRELEVVFTATLQQLGLFRLDYLGSHPGMWTLHPPFRSDVFYKKLPSLIDDIEKGVVPRSQLGKYDVVDELVDWSPQRRFRRIKSKYKQFKAIFRLG